MKKSSTLYAVLFTLAFSMFVMPLASAYYLPTVRDGIQLTVDTVVDALSPVVQGVLGGDVWGGEQLFAKLLIFVIVFLMVYLGLKNVPRLGETKPVLWILTIVVAILSVRYLDYAWIEGLITSYKVLAIALTVLLPFILYFFFVHNALVGQSILRKLAWVLLGLVYLGLWSNVVDEYMSMIYFWTILAVVFMIIFDKSIQGYFEGDATRKANSIRVRERLASAIDRLNKLQANPEAHAFDLTHSSRDKHEYARLVRRYQDEIDSLRGEL